MSKIMIVRRKNYANGALIRFAVRLDGSVIRKLWNGRQVELFIESGTHTIQITCFPAKSELITFDEKDGEVALFECGPVAGGGVGNIVEGLARRPTLLLRRTG